MKIFVPVRNVSMINHAHSLQQIATQNGLFRQRSETSGYLQAIPFI
jgi:hypothetical protein